MSSDFFAFLKWYLAVTVIGAAAYPLAFRLFRRLPDRGYTLARTFGLLIISWLFWLLGSVGLLQNDAGGMLLAGAVVAGVGLWALKREGLSELRGWLREQRATVIAVEIVFLAAFILMAWVRAHNPKIENTEKPMEYMFINAIWRSPAFPPSDAWLSGHAVSYYYFGYFMVAALARLTDTLTAVSFNLALALLFALTAVGALGVVMNLIALETKRKQKDEEERLHPSSFILHPSFWPALLAPVLVLVVGNFYGVFKLAHDNGMLKDAALPAVYYDFGVQHDPAVSPQTLADFSSPPGLRVGMINLWTWLNLKGLSETPPNKPAAFVVDSFFWRWFSGARVVHDRNLIGVETEAIDEMPAFSFLLGDLHPHVLALPFVALALALALDWLLWATALGVWDFGIWDLFRSPLLAPRLFFSALSLGGLAFLNTWDFPIYWFVMTAALIGGLGLAWGWADVWKRWRAWAGLPIVIALLSIVLYLPFYFTFQNQAGGLLPNLIYPTRFQQTVIFFGPVLVGVSLFVFWLARHGRAVLDGKAAVMAGSGIVLLLLLAVLVLTFAASLRPELASFVDSAIAPLSRLQAIALLWQRRAVDSLAFIFPALLIGLTIGLGVGLLRNGHSPLTTHLHSPALLMVLVIILTGALLMLGPEFVYLRDNFGSRMNTMFKFYFQTWVLWALASAYGAWHLWRHAGSIGRAVTATLMTLSIAAGMLYTVPTLNSKFVTDAPPDGPTLDGMANFAAQHPDDWAAIQWLQQNASEASGQPVLAEGIGGSYWVEGRFSRFSMATGLPTVMGWPGHEQQWRGPYFFAKASKVSEREGDIRTLYTTRDWATARDILTRYNIEYVIASGLEKDKYKPAYFAKFDQFMRVAFQSGEVTIYQRLESQ